MIFIFDLWNGSILEQVGSYGEILSMYTDTYNFNSHKTVKTYEYVFLLIFNHVQFVTKK